METRTATASDHGILDPATVARVHLRRPEPSADVAVVVERFWALDWIVPQPRGEATLPHPCVNIVFGTVDPGVHGPGRHVDTRIISGRGWVFAAKLRPGALVALGVADAADLVDAALPLRSVFGATAQRLERRMATAGDDDQRRRLLEAALRVHLPVRDHTFDDFAAVVAVMVADRSLVRVAQVVEATGWSTRTLQRWFGHYLALSPAWVLSRYRLHEAADTLAWTDEPDLAELAARLGYYDQAHFTRSFTTTIGRPPGAYARWCRAQRAGFTAVAG